MLARLLRFSIGLAGCLASFSILSQEDWPQFQGPTRNGIAAPTDKTLKWTSGDPEILWKYPLGSGYSGPVAYQNTVLIFHRQNNSEILQALERDTGQALWNFSYPTQYRDDFGFDDGPRSTPTIHEDQIFIMGADGLVHAINLKTGTKIWSYDTRDKLDTPKGFFGMVCSPLVVENRVLIGVGGQPNAGIIALDTQTGQLLWKATQEEASYSSPILTQFYGKPLALFFMRGGLFALKPDSGEIAFSYPWRARMHASVNAATPLVRGNEVFLSASYQTGAIVLRINPQFKPEKVWAGDDILSNHFLTSVETRGYLYGIDGRHEYTPRLRCVEWATGKVKWTEEGLGSCHILFTAPHGLLLRENGELLLSDLNPKHFEIRARSQVLGSGIRAAPALANGLFLARDPKNLIALKILE